MKKFLLFLLSFTLLFLTVGCCSSGDLEEDATAVDTVKVKIEIDCSDILKNYDLLDDSLKDEKFVPQDGFILKETQVDAKAGDSAVDVLKRICSENKIHIDEADGYVKGINNVYEKSCGDMSGWIYEVNGDAIMDEYTVSEGDLISWIYICDFSTFTFE